jgi:hypothetical protein
VGEEVTLLEMFMRKSTDDHEIFALQRPLEYYYLVRQAGLTFCVVRGMSVKFVLREDNVKFNTPSEESVSIITYNDSSRKSL